MATTFILPRQIRQRTREIGISDSIRPLREHLLAASDILTGIEIEFRPNGQVSIGVDRYSGRQVIRPMDSGNYNRGNPAPEGWEAGRDYSNAEVRSAGPTPLLDQLKLLRSARTYIGRMNPHMNHNCSFHVHVNINPDVGPAAPKHELVSTYFLLRPIARQLVVEPERINCRWCRELHPTTRFEDLQEFCKETELNSDPEFGTIEMRLWDATNDKGLQRLRLEFLSYWIGAALRKHQEDPYIEPVIAADSINWGSAYDNFDVDYDEPDNEWSLGTRRLLFSNRS